MRFFRTEIFDTTIFSRLEVDGGKVNGNRLGDESGAQIPGFGWTMASC